jgi:alcohol dehydrogenase class IV
MRSPKSENNRLLLKLVGPQDLLIVSKSFLDLNEKMKEQLYSISNNVAVVSVANPTWRTCVETFVETRFIKWERIVAIGGGSVIDFCKGLVALRTLDKFHLFDSELSIHETNTILSERKSKERISFLAVPTMAGSGAEFTKFATFWNCNATKGSPKESLEDDRLQPTEIQVVPQFLFSAPRDKLLAGAFDVVAHCIESHFSVKATEESRQYSREGLQIILNTLTTGLEFGKTQKSISELIYAAQLGGKAINIAKTNVCHSISYPLTCKFGISHGYAAAISLPSYLEAARKGSHTLYSALTGHQSLHDLTAKLRLLMDFYDVRKSVRERVGLKSELLQCLPAMKSNDRYRNCSFGVGDRFIEDVANFIFLGT